MSLHCYVVDLNTNKSSFTCNLHKSFSWASCRERKTLHINSQPYSEKHLSNVYAKLHFSVNIQSLRAVHDDKEITLLNFDAVFKNTFFKKLIAVKGTT